MNFTWNTDQQAVMDAVQRLAAAYGTRAVHTAVRMEYSPSLQQLLHDSGLAQCMAEPELGAVTAVGLVMELSQPMVCVELVGTTLVAPLVCPQAPGPFALIETHERVPVRFLPVARTVVRVQAGRAQWAALQAGDTEAVPSVFAYPMGCLRAPEALAWQDAVGADGAPVCSVEVVRLWRLGVAAEIVGSLQAALAAVLEHVRERRQFGRPLGAFQAVQHRLAQCATAIEGARWLCLHAAHTGKELDALLALGQAQQMVTPVCYDLHQFMGAMGLTLEHPLHRWTYRVKSLRSEWGGAAQHMAQAADAAWGSGRVRDHGKEHTA